MVNLTIVNCEFCCRVVTVGQAIKINFPYFSPIQWDKINLPCTVHIKLSNRSKCVIQLRHFIATTLLLYNLEFLFVTIVIFFVCCLNWVRRKTGTFIIQLPFPRKPKISNGWLATRVFHQIFRIVVKNFNLTVESELIDFLWCPIRIQSVKTIFAHLQFRFVTDQMMNEFKMLLDQTW